MHEADLADHLLEAQGQVAADHPLDSRMKIWPPSRIGIGIRFMMAMLMLMKPIRWSEVPEAAPRRLAGLRGDLDRAGERALGRQLAA